MMAFKMTNEQDQSRLKKLCWIAALQCYIEGDGRCSQQDENHGIFELAEESFNNGFAFSFAFKRFSPTWVNISSAWVEVNPDRGSVFNSLHTSCEDRSYASIVK